MEFKEVPLAKIKIGPKQVRMRFEEKALRSLARSIDEVGQIQPIILKKDKPGYTLIAGERRVRALRAGEKEKVWALILDQKIDEEKCHLIQLAENIQRENLNPLERAKAIKDYMEMEDLTKKEASQRLGLPRTTLTEWLNILEVNEFYQQKVLENFYNEDSPLTLSHISLANALNSQVKDPTKKTELLNMVLKHHLSRGETRRVVEMCSKNTAMTIEEAVSAILINREQKLIRPGFPPKQKNVDCIEGLKQAIVQLEEAVEGLMDNDPQALSRGKENIIQDFIFLYRLFCEAIPELSDLEGCLEKYDHKTDAENEKQLG